MLIRSSFNFAAHLAAGMAFGLLAMVAMSRLVDRRGDTARNDPPKSHEPLPRTE